MRTSGASAQSQRAEMDVSRSQLSRPQEIVGAETGFEANEQSTKTANRNISTTCDSDINIGYSGWRVDGTIPKIWFVWTSI